MAEKESVFELDLKLEDVLKIVSEISDSTKERSQSEKEILKLLSAQYGSLDDINKGSKDSINFQDEKLKRLEKLADFESKADKRDNERRKKEREHIGFLRKSFEWLTGYQGIKGFLNMRVPSLPALMMGGAATGLGLGMAGYYGYGRMANEAGNLRFQGQGAFSSPAQLQAAKSVYENRWFGNVDAMVQNIEGLRTNATDPTGLLKLERLVGKIDANMSNVDILAKMPTAIQKNVEQYIKETGDKELKLTGYGSLAPYGLDFLSPDVIRRGMPGTMKADETAGLEGVYKKTVKEFEPLLGDKGLMEYQNTKMQMDLAMLRIQNSFMDALKILNPEIQRLSESASDLIKTFLQSKTVKKAIDNLDKSLKDFDKWLADDKRKDTLAALMYDLDVFGGMVYAAASGLGGLAKMLGFVGEKTLKATEYQALLGIRETNPVFADKMKEALENPNDARRVNNAIKEFQGLPHEKQKELTDKYGKQFNAIFAGALQFDNSLSMDLKEVNQFLKQSSIVYKTLNDVLGASIAGGLATIDFVKEQAVDTHRYFGIKSPSMPSFFSEAQAADLPARKDNSPNLITKLQSAGKKYGFDANAILKTYQESSLNPNILLAQAYQESKFNPNEKSKAGARGFAQFMPETAKQYGLKDALNAEESAKAQVRYMKYLTQELGNQQSALAGYNWGEGKRGSKHREQILALQGLPKETSDYVRNIIGMASDKPPAGKPDYSDLKLKSSETIAGGKAHPATIELAKVLQSQITGFNRITGINDIYHKEDKTSKHSHGLAIDFTIADKTKSREVEKQIYDIMESLNVKGYVLDEYTKKSKRKTAPHMHVNFKNENEADKFYSELQKQQPKPDNFMGKGYQAYTGARAFENKPIATEYKAFENKPISTFKQNKPYQQPITWQPVIMKRGEESVHKTMGESKVLIPKKQNLTNVKVTIDNRSGTDLISQSVSAGL